LHNCARECGNKQLVHKAFKLAVGRIASAACTEAS
jgi:hypothetical protein